MINDLFQNLSQKIFNYYKKEDIYQMFQFPIVFFKETDVNKQICYYG